MSAASKPEIRFLKGRPTITVEPQTNLMQALLAAGLPVASSCQGDGVCAKCRIHIDAGAKNLSPENATEKFLRERHDIPRSERISCQVEVEGPITVDASYW